MGKNEFIASKMSDPICKRVDIYRRKILFSFIDFRVSDSASSVRLLFWRERRGEEKRENLIY